jgi:flagellar hook-basal body complex protein FliE
MAINSISGVGGTASAIALPPSLGGTNGDTSAGDSFQKLLGDAIGSLSKLQAEADSSAARLAAGEQVELHEVLLAAERATIAFQLTVQVRNKLIEAYQEVMRMQV